MKALGILGHRKILETEPSRFQTLAAVHASRLFHFVAMAKVTKSLVAPTVSWSGGLPNILAATALVSLLSARRKRWFVSRAC